MPSGVRIPPSPPPIFPVIAEKDEQAPRGHAVPAHLLPRLIPQLRCRGVSASLLARPGIEACGWPPIVDVACDVAGLVDRPSAAVLNRSADETYMVSNVGHGVPIGASV